MAVALFVTSCGDGGDDDTSTVSTLSRAEFIKQANRACREERAGLMKEVSEFERNRSPGKTRPYSDAVHFIYLPIMEAQIWRIGELGTPPRGDAGRIEAMLDAEKFAIDELATTPRVPSIAAAEREFVEADKLFRAYGLHSCAAANGA